MGSCVFWVPSISKKAATRSWIFVIPGCRSLVLKGSNIWAPLPHFALKKILYPPRVVRGLDKAHIKGKCFMVDKAVWNANRHHYSWELEVTIKDEGLRYIPNALFPLPSSSWTPKCPWARAGANCSYPRLNPNEVKTQISPLYWINSELRSVSADELPADWTKIQTDWQWQALWSVVIFLKYFKI